MTAGTDGADVPALTGALLPFAARLFARFPEVFLALGQASLGKYFDLPPGGSAFSVIEETKDYKLVQVVMKRAGLKDEDLPLGLVGYGCTWRHGKDEYLGTKAACNAAYDKDSQPRRRKYRGDAHVASSGRHAGQAAATFGACKAPSRHGGGGTLTCLQDDEQDAKSGRAAYGRQEDATASRQEEHHRRPHLRESRSNAMAQAMVQPSSAAAATMQQQQQYFASSTDSRHGRDAASLPTTSSGALREEVPRRRCHQAADAEEDAPVQRRPSLQLPEGVVEARHYDPSAPQQAPHQQQPPSMGSCSSDASKGTKAGSTTAASAGGQQPGFALSPEATTASESGPSLPAPSSAASTAGAQQAARIRSWSDWIGRDYNLEPTEDEAVEGGSKPASSEAASAPPEAAQVQAAAQKDEQRDAQKQQGGAEGDSKVKALKSSEFASAPVTSSGASNNMIGSKKPGRTGSKRASRKTHVEPASPRSPGSYDPWAGECRRMSKRVNVPFVRCMTD
eukprot:TRINITY_DN14744_c0_g1_i1.p1 TRINITY_DN14744_c0_g1~~TRINITY_DN14744_c0_g1_i1.p1  ORF type:complete len:507 (-),score=136.92 TRINITY_DN14744_c0_g1_i1:82-1602(-)